MTDSKSAIDIIKAASAPDAPEESAIDLFKRNRQAAPYLELRASRETPPSALDFLKGNEAAAKERALALSRKVSTDIDPGRQARALEVAKAKRIPVDAAYQFIEDLTHKPAPGYGEMAKTAPFTANLAADPFKGPVVFGDEKSLMEIEKGLTSFLQKREKVETFGPRAPTFMEGVQSRLYELSGQTFRDLMFGQGAGELSPEDATADHQRRIAETIAGIDRNLAMRQQAEQAKVDMQRQMATAGASEIDMTPEQRAALPQPSDAVVAATPVMEMFTKGLDEARKALDTALEVRPDLNLPAELFDVSLNTVSKITVGAVEGVSRWTDFVRSMGPGFIDAVNEYLPNAGNTLDIAARIYEMFPPADPLDAEGVSGTTKDLAGVRQTIDSLFPGDAAQQNDFIPKAVGAAASIVPFVMAGFVAKALALNPGAVAGALGSLSMGADAANDATSHKATPLERNVAMVIASVMGWTESLPVDNIFDMAGKNVGKGFRHFVTDTFLDIVKQGAIEGGQEVVQGLPIDAYASMTFDKARNVWANASDNFLYGAIAGGPFAALGALARAMPVADRGVKTLDAIAAAAGSSNTLKIAPDLVKEHITEMVKDGKVPATVSAAVESVETLFQEVWSDVAKPAYEALRKAVDEANRLGTEVSIPAELIPFIAQLNGFKKLSDDIRMPDSLTPNEVRQLHDELKTYVEGVDKIEAQPSIENSGVHTQVRDQLIAAGQSPEVAATQATIFTATMENFAQRTGQTPEALMKRYGFSVQSTVSAPAAGETRLNQGPRYPMAPSGEWYSNSDYKARGGRIVEMTPDQYLRSVRPLNIDEVSRDNIDDLKNHIQSGRTLDPPAIYADGKEDGRHRAVAAKELGIQNVPVLVFGNPKITDVTTLAQQDITLSPTDPLLQLDGEWRDSSVILTASDGTLLEANAGDAVDFLRKVMAGLEELRRCVNAA